MGSEMRCEADLCACGCALYVDPPGQWGGDGERYETLPIDGTVAIIRVGCYPMGETDKLYDRIRENRRRSQSPKAEPFKVGDRVRLNEKSANGNHGHKDHCGTITGIGVGTVDIRYDWGLQGGAMLGAIEHLPPAEDPKAKGGGLEALEFVAVRDFKIYDKCCGCHPHGIAGARLTFRPAADSSGDWHFDCGLLQQSACEKCAPRIHAELLALRDGTGVRDSAPSEDPKGGGVERFKVGDRVCRKYDSRLGKVSGVNVNGAVHWTSNCGRHFTDKASELVLTEETAHLLRHLAEAFRSLATELDCVECGGSAPAWRFFSRDVCGYCAHRDAMNAGITVNGVMRFEDRDLGIHRITQAPPAPEPERRHPADWDVDPDAPDGCA